MAKFEILNREFEKELIALDEELQTLKNRAADLSQAYKDNEYIYTSQFSAVLGIGSIFMIFNAITFARSQATLEKFAERQNFSAEAKEFLSIQKERVNLVIEAQKLGLKVNFNPEKDIEDFMKAEGKFRTESIYDVFIKNNAPGFAEKYKSMSEFAKEFIKKNTENKEESSNKREFNHARV